MENKIQTADKILNINYAENIIITISSRENIYNVWDIALGNAHGDYSYRNQNVDIPIRSKEWKDLCQKMEGSTPLKILGITGRGGSGKSSIAYRLFKEMGEVGWKCKAIKSDCIDKINHEDLISTDNILIIIDYLLPFADNVGKWIRNLYRVQDEQLNRAKQNGRNTNIYGVIRIILIERACVLPDKKPYWYKAIVETYDLENICDYHQFISLEKLSDLDTKCFIKYYMNKKCKNISEKKLDEMIKGIVVSEDCRYPLFISYMCDALIEDPTNNSRNWSRAELLKYVDKIERRRLEGFTKSPKILKSLEKIFIFSLVIDGISLQDKIPYYLLEDFKVLMNEWEEIQKIFRDVGEVDDNMFFKPAMPEIVGEFYCLEFIRRMDNEPGGPQFVKEFISQAWCEKPNEFGGFLCRLLEDFHKDDMISILGKMLQMPEGMDTEKKCLYADLLREFTYWFKKPQLCYVKVVDTYEHILNNINEVDKCHKIKILYATALFNIIWSYCEYCDYNAQTSSEVMTLFDKLQEISKNCREKEMIDLCNGARQKVKQKWNCIIA